MVDVRKQNTSVDISKGQPTSSSVHMSGILSPDHGSKRKRRKDLIRRLKRVRRYKPPVPTMGNPKKQRRKGVLKHYGPIHPGTGTDQSVHGTQGAFFDVTSPTHENMMSVLSALYDRSSTSFSDEKSEAMKGLDRTMELMEEDPRWEEAEREWARLEWPEHTMQDIEDEAYGIDQRWRDFLASTDLESLTDHSTIPADLLDNYDIYLVGDSIAHGVMLDVGDYVKSSDMSFSGEEIIESISDDGSQVVVDGQVLPIDMVYSVDDVSLIVLEPGDFHDLQSISDDFNSFETQYGMDPLAIAAGEATVDNPAFDNPNVFSVHDSYNSGEYEYVTNIRDVPHGMRTLWANTAADEHKWALAAQAVVAKEFGLDDSVISPRLDFQVQDIVDRYGTGIAVWARATYNMTQEYLTERGIESLPLARGMKLSHLGDLGDLVEAERAGTMFEASRWDAPHEAIRTTTGDGLDWTPAALDLNPLSSWSSRIGTATSFAGSQYKTILKAAVPREQIFGISLRGNGALSEQEAIVLGGVDSVQGEVMAVNTRLWGIAMSGDTTAYKEHRDVLWDKGVKAYLGVPEIKDSIRGRGYGEVIVTG